jgi:hypothetical protein
VGDAAKGRRAAGPAPLRVSGRRNVTPTPQPHRQRHGCRARRSRRYTTPMRACLTAHWPRRTSRSVLARSICPRVVTASRQCQYNRRTSKLLTACTLRAGTWTIARLLTLPSHSKLFCRRKSNAQAMFPRPLPVRKAVVSSRRIGLGATTQRVRPRYDISPPNTSAPSKLLRSWHFATSDKLTDTGLAEFERVAEAGKRCRSVGPGDPKRRDAGNRLILTEHGPAALTIRSRTIMAVRVAPVMRPPPAGRRSGSSRQRPRAAA